MKTTKEKEKEIFLKGAESMLKWIESSPINGGARRMLDLHLSPIKDYMKQFKNLIK